MQKAFTTDDARWQAVLDHSAAADGEFYYAVITTGVYCRTRCPSRRPRRESVRFFETPHEAEQAGFRACKRCRPGALSTEQRVVAQVQRLLDETEETITLVELAASVHVSPYHLQRLFKRATGFSPKEYARVRRAERLKVQLRQGATVTDALYEAGYGSSRALYEEVGRQLGMTPGEYRNGGVGQRIAYGFADTSFGRVMVAATGRGVCALRFGPDGETLDGLRQEFPRADLERSDDGVAPYLAAIQEHLMGQKQGLDIALDLRHTPFQQRVWEALRSIPYGEVRSYSEIARMIGEPGSVRAVARACASNPVALAVPCHRVIRADGSLSGYRWGRERKEALLDQERRLAVTTA